MSYESAKARLERATSGKWRAVCFENGDHIGNGVDAEDEPVIEPNRYFRVVDAEFIAHSRQDLEAALEVVRLARSYARATRSAGSKTAYWGLLQKALDEFEALP